MAGRGRRLAGGISYGVQRVRAVGIDIFMSYTEFRLHAVRLPKSHVRSSLSSMDGNPV